MKAEGYSDTDTRDALALMKVSASGTVNENGFAEFRNSELK